MYPFCNLYCPDGKKRNKIKKKLNKSCTFLLLKLKKCYNTKIGHNTLKIGLKPF